MEQFIERQNRYTGYEAMDILNEKWVLPEKEVMYNLKVKPLKLFWKLYVKKQGFREGRIGLIFSIMYSYVHFMKWSKAIATDISKKDGFTYSRMLFWFFTKVITSSSAIILPSTLILSLKSFRCGDV